MTLPPCGEMGTHRKQNLFSGKRSTPDLRKARRFGSTKVPRVGKSFFTSNVLAQQAVTQRRHEHSEEACGRDEAELFEELRYQQPDVHGRSLAAFWGMGRGHRSRAALSSYR